MTADRRARARPLGVATGVLLVALVALTTCAQRSAPESSRQPADRGDWTVTVYYTAVEDLHDGEPRTVTGCLTIDCAHGDQVLGRYPADFVRAVHDEGTGRITSGEHAGKYLNWSHNTGYWLDTAPRDGYGRPLRPWVSAAADPDVLREGQKFRISDCGRVRAHSAHTDVCDRLREPTWQIRDQFTPGFGGPHHVDVYIGEETVEDFTTTPMYTTLRGATLELIAPK